MARLRGRAPKGQRVKSYIPHGHWKTSTFVAVLSSQGIAAPMILEGPMNGEVFLAYTNQFLAPVLKPGDRVIMDNLSSHKVAGVEEAIEAAGASVLYLPPYSPDLNPIEQAFSKLKALLRKAAKREIEALWRALPSCLDAFSITEFSNYIRNSGYCMIKQKML